MLTTDKKTVNKDLITNKQLKYFHLSLIILTIINGLFSDLISWHLSPISWTISPIILLVIFVSSKLYIVQQNHVRYYVLSSLFLIIAILFPSSLFSWAALSVISLLGYCLDPRSRHSHILFLGLSLSYIWKSVIFKLVSGDVLMIETEFIGSVVSCFLDGVTATGNILYINEKHSLSIGLGCSVFSNLSLSLLGWASLRVLITNTIPPITHFIGITSMMVILNTVRISLMAIDFEWYDYVHNGNGATWYDAVVCLLITSALFNKQLKGQKNV